MYEFLGKSFFAAHPSVMGDRWDLIVERDGKQGA